MLSVLRLLPFQADKRAVAMVEFAIVAPVYLLLFFAICGVGLDGFYQITLDDAVRNAARQIQIDGPAVTNGTAFVAAVCSEFGALTGPANCQANISYNVQASPVYDPANPTTTGYTALSPASLPASGNFANTFFANGTAYADNVNILVQTAYPLPFSLPYVGNLITETGTNSIVASTTTRAEPIN